MIHSVTGLHTNINFGSIQNRTWIDRCFQASALAQIHFEAATQTTAVASLVHRTIGVLEYCPLIGCLIGFLDKYIFGHFLFDAPTAGTVPSGGGVPAPTVASGDVAASEIGGAYSAAAGAPRTESAVEAFALPLPAAVDIPVMAASGGGSGVAAVGPLARVDLPEECTYPSLHSDIFEYAKSIRTKSPLGEVELGEARRKLNDKYSAATAEVIADKVAAKCRLLVSPREDTYVGFERQAFVVAKQVTDEIIGSWSTLSEDDFKGLIAAHQRRRGYSFRSIQVRYDLSDSDIEVIKSALDECVTISRDWLQCASMVWKEYDIPGVAPIKPDRLSML